MMKMKTRWNLVLVVNLRVSVSGIAKAGHCSFCLNNELYYGNGRKKVGKQKPFSAGEPQNLGQILHELVQHVMIQPVDERQNAVIQMQNWLNISRKQRSLVPEITQLIRPGLLNGTHINSMTQDICTIGRTLLLASNRLLSHLEQQYSESEGRWEVEMEHCIHQEEVYSHMIFGEPTEIRGFIDLVFSWENIVVLVELKTGARTELSLGSWKRQIACYMHVWRELCPNVDVRGFVVQHSFSRGFIEITDETDNPLTYEFNIEQVNVPQDGCIHCYHRMSW